MKLVSYIAGTSYPNSPKTTRAVLYHETILCGNGLVQNSQQAISLSSEDTVRIHVSPEHTGLRQSEKKQCWRMRDIICYPDMWK